MRLRTLRIATVFLLTCLPFLLPAQCGVFYDGFESGTLGPQWLFGTGSYTRVVNTVNPGVGQYSLTHSSTGANGFYQGTYALFTPSQPDYISYWMRTNTTTAANGYVVIGNSNIATDNGIVFCYFNATSGLRFFNTAGQNYPITANTWYHVELRDIDWVARNMDVYINGVLWLTNWAFRSTTANNMDRIHLHSLSASAPQYDEIQIGDIGVTIDSVNVSMPQCFGDSSGAIDLEASTPNGNITYAWSNGSSTQDLINLTAGSYVVSLTDSAGCTTTDSITVTQPNAISNANVIQSVTCPGGQDGGLDITTSGGTPGYAYAWSTSATTEDLSNLAAGTYTLVTTDTNGCQQTDSFLVPEPAAFNTNAVPTSPSCFGGTNGSIDLTMSGGTPGYLFAWSNSASTEDISGVPSGIYAVTVTDTVGCTYSDTITVAIAPPLLLNPQISNLDCNGDQSGAIDLTPAGGNPTYVFSWSNGAITEDLSNLNAGTYFVTVTDVNSCVVVDTLVVTEPAVVSASAVITNATNLPSQGSIDLTPAGGTSPYTYNWSNGATTQDISNLTPGNYTVTVTDANGCIATATYFVDLVQSSGDPIQFAVQVYPNPSSGQVWVKVASNTMDDVQVEIIDAQGRIIWAQTTSANAELSIDKQLVAGVYLVRVVTQNASHTTTLVRQ